MIKSAFSGRLARGGICHITQTLLVVKLTVFFMTVFFLNVFAKGVSQHVTFSGDSVSLESVFTSVRKQTGFLFLFTEPVLMSARPVTIKAKNLPLNKFLIEVFRDQPLRYDMNGKSIFVSVKESGNLSGNGFLPPALIRGRVFDDSGRPLAGASILIKGSNQSAVSNVDGVFNINVNAGDVLLVSYVGFRVKEVKITEAVLSNTKPGSAESYSVIISLTAAATRLDDVVVEANTGYQKVKPNEINGSVVVINNGLLNEQVSTSILGRLEAVANGVSVYRKHSTQGQLMIRGLSTIQGPKNPLIVVDNFPYEGDINNINPNDIENITILKDAAAASIWGTRAGNGVIVISTKRGKFNQPLTVELNSNITFTGKPDLFYLKPMSSSDYIDVEQFLFSNQFRFSDTNNTDRPPFSPVYELLFSKASGKISAEQATLEINALRQKDIRNDFNKYFYKTGINQQYAINMRGGSSNISWILSVGYDHNISNLDARYNRLNLRSENTFQLHKRLKLTAGIYYTSSRSENGKPGYGDLSSQYGIPSYSSLVDNNGNAAPLYTTYRKPYIDTIGGGKLLNWNYYPLEDYRHSTDINSTQDILSRFAFTYSILPELNLDILYQFEKQQTENRKLNDLNSFFARNLINSYSQLNYTTGKVTYIIPKGSILDLANSTLRSNSVRGQLNYNKTWQKNTVSAFAGLELRDNRVNGTGYRFYGYNDDVLSTGNVDYINTYPLLVYGFNDLVPSNNSITGTVSKFISTYANVAYTYDRKYSFSASVRRDGSNIFGAATTNKWTPLWSVGAGWILSDEQFYNMPFLPYLKLRATYGYSGNIDPANTAVTTAQYQSNSIYTLTPVAVINRYYNPELRWERVATFNAGIDFRTRSNILSGTLDFYQKRGTDLFGTSPLDYTVGLSRSTITKNVANMISRGVDLQLSTRNIDRVVKWTTDLNLNFNKDKVTSYFLASKQGRNFINGGSGIAGVEGAPVYAIYSFKWAGLDPLNGDPRTILNGEISKNYPVLVGPSTLVSDLVYNGSAMPTLFGSLGNTVAWKGFSVSVRLMYKFGYFFQRSSLDYTSFFNGGNGHEDYRLRWQKPGDEMITNVPSIVYPANRNRDVFYNNSEILIEKGDHIRFQYLTVGYELPKIKGLPVRNVKIYANVNNVGIVWRANKHNLDPDYRSTAIPPSASIAFGVKAQL